MFFLNISPFSKLLNPSVSTITVCGSKNDPVFKSKNPEIFIGVHGAIAHSSNFTGNTEKWGVLTNYFLISNWRTCDRIRNVIRDSRVDKLIVIEAVSRVYEDIYPEVLLDIPKESVFRIKQWRCTLLELKYLSNGYFKEYVWGLGARRCAGIFLQLASEQTSWRTRLSTGVFTALGVFASSSPKLFIEVVGVGLQKNGLYFYDTSGELQKGGHYEQDLWVAKRMSVAKAGRSVYFTDSMARKQLVNEDR